MARRARGTGTGRTGALRRRLFVWGAALVAGGSLAVVAYFVDWAVSMLGMSFIMIVAILLLSRAYRREKASIEERLVRVAREREMVIDALLNGLGLGVSARMADAERVARLASIVAWQMGLREEDSRLVKQAAILHDVGKMGIAEGVLAKPGKLSEAEWTQMRRHPEAGYEIMAQAPSLRAAAEIVRCHHERFDGQGYPQGMRGRDIPIGSRIYAVVDAYVAMTSERPHRRKFQHDIAVREILRNSLTQFDPEVVEAFLEAERNGLLREPGRDARRAPVAAEA